jgi:hypothetical protein
MDDSCSSGQENDNTHMFMVAVPWPLIGVGRTDDNEALLAMGFLPTGLGHCGKSVLPTLGW